MNVFSESYRFHKKKKKLIFKTISKRTSTEPMLVRTSEAIALLTKFVYALKSQILRNKNKNEYNYVEHTKIQWKLLFKMSLRPIISLKKG